MLRKKKPDEINIVKQFEQAIVQNPDGKYVLRLFVTGMTPKSVKAIENIKKFCAENLSGRYELEVIDIYQQPLLAKDGQIIAAPTLIKQLPLPLRRLVGDMSDFSKILVGLDIKTK
jgi:circadian clock protein KaiB